MNFDPLQHKIVVLLAEELPLGLAMNALSVISVSLGKDLQGLVGQDLFSLDRVRYPGVVTAPLPILKAPQALLDTLLGDFRASVEVTTYPFSCLAQSCKTYPEYEEKLSGQPSSDLRLAGLCLVGPRKEINKVSGSLALYR